MPGWKFGSLRGGKRSLEGCRSASGELDGG